jgi:cysteine synthase A
LTSVVRPPRPAYQVFDIDSGLADSPVGYPCVIKPTDGTGSVGVRICADQAELAAAIALFRAKWQTVRGFRLARQWLVEEYVDGSEYSAELVWHDGRWHLLGITEKILAAPPFCVEIGHLFPAALSGDVQLAIAHQCSAWLQAIGLDFGAAHIEFRLSDHTPVLMEINPRLGGDMLPELIRLATGFDVLRHLFMQHAGNAAIADPRAVRATQTAAIRFLLAPHSGTVQEIRGRASVASLPGVSRCMLRPTPFEATAAESSYDRLGYVIATGDSRQQALQRVSAAIALLDIVYA